MDACDPFPLKTIQRLAWPWRRFSKLAAGFYPSYGGFREKSRISK
jgi:hypothetical protein